MTAPENKVEIYKAENGQFQVEVKFEEETVWLNRNQLAVLFGRDVKTIGKHINNVFQEGELEEDATVAKFATVQNEGERIVQREIEYYSLDVIISVGYRVKSLQATRFRQWATRRLKEYLIQGYSINEKRLLEKEQEVKYLKTGIRILNRAIEEKINNSDIEWLNLFAKGLELLDDYDHKQLDTKGSTQNTIIYPEYDEYISFIKEMHSRFESDIFAKPKDDSFKSSINQIRQSFDGTELYPTLEEKAAMLLYLIVKNHSFIDGNKRIAAACFLLFLRCNNALYNMDETPIISNDALAALTLFVAMSNPEEKETVKDFIVSIINRNRD